MNKRAYFLLFFVMTSIILSTKSSAQTNIGASQDASRKVVINFRKEKFPMPWLHAIDRSHQAIDSKMAKQFEVYFYPTAFLVDASGKIIARRKISAAKSWRSY